LPEKDDKLKELLKDMTLVTFLKKGKGETKTRIEQVLTSKKELSNVRKRFRGWHEAKPVKGMFCEKCGKAMLDWDLWPTSDGVYRFYRCADLERCKTIITKKVASKEQLEAWRIALEKRKHCGREMKDSWKFCPYCGEELPPE